MDFFIVIFLLYISSKVRKMPETQEQTLERIGVMDAKLTATKASLVGIGEDVASLKDQIAGGGMTPDAITAALDALGTKAVDAAESAATLDAETPGGED